MKINSFPSLPHHHLPHYILFNQNQISNICFKSWWAYFIHEGKKGRWVNRCNHMDKFILSDEDVCLRWRNNFLVKWLMLDFERLLKSEISKIYYINLIKIKHARNYLVRYTKRLYWELEFNKQWIVKLIIFRLYELRSI